LSTTNPTCCSDANPGRCGGKPAANRLNYGTAENSVTQFIFSSEQFLRLSMTIRFSLFLFFLPNVLEPPHILILCQTLVRSFYHILHGPTHQLRISDFDHLIMTVTEKINLRFEIFKTVIINNTVFWEAM
jgi:hypothetical protein